MVGMDEQKIHKRVQWQGTQENRIDPGQKRLFDQVSQGKGAPSRCNI